MQAGKGGRGGALQCLVGESEMSRKAKRPITVPDGVSVELANHRLTVSGKKGKLTLPVHPDIGVSYDNDRREIRVSKSVEELEHKGLLGLFWALINNMVAGVTEGFERSLEIKGIGYNARLQGEDLVLQLGFSHPVVMHVPEGLEVELPSNTRVIVRGADKQLVGEFAAEIRRLRKPSPYPHGTGIRYSDEEVRKKAGKTFTSVG